jgi:hypothetical protein
VKYFRFTAPIEVRCQARPCSKAAKFMLMLISGNLYEIRILVCEEHKDEAVSEFKVARVTRYSTDAGGSDHSGREHNGDRLDLCGLS